jgi:hypothetical protein
MPEPYLVTAIRQLASLEAKDTPTPDETARLNAYRRWLGEHYPDVSAALAREYRDMHSREAQCSLSSRSPAASSRPS